MLDTKEKIKNLKCVVVIPTYNNGKTLRNLLEGVLEYSTNVIVVNDGSTDETSEILNDFVNRITLITHKKNQGKGIALKNAIRKAYSLSYNYAISIDSDGQHFPEDIPAFIKKIEEEPDSLIIGARNMDQEGIPGKSSFGNKFSNFWYWVETGIKLPDTQSGYRLYPLKYVGEMKFFTPKFEFEIEIIVRAAWKGVNVTSVPVKVKYFKEDERVSHFRPFKDFTRISILNTVLVTLALAWFLPLLFFKRLKKKGLKAILGAHESNAKIASAIGLGVFMGIFPVWGYQMLIAAALAHFFKINKAITLIASNISVPPMIPFIIFGSFEMGAILVKNPIKLSFNKEISLEFIKSGLIQYVFGSVALAILSGIIAYFVALIFFNLTRRKK